MDSRYPDRMPQSLKELQESGQKVFIPFVKPWHDLERCKKWVNACSRKNFTTESITKNSYICALHWPKLTWVTSASSAGWVTSASIRLVASTGSVGVT